MQKSLVDCTRLRAADGDLAFADLYQQLADRVTRYIAVRVGATARSRKTLTAKTFLKVLEAMRRGKGGAKHARVGVRDRARHVVADYYLQRRQTISLDVVRNVAAAGPSLAEITTQQLKLERVASALQALAPDRAEALALRIFGGLSTAEVAQTLGKITPGCEDARLSGCTRSTGASGRIMEMNRRVMQQAERLDRYIDASLRRNSISGRISVSSISSWPWPGASRPTPLFGKKTVEIDRHIPTEASSRALGQCGRNRDARSGLGPDRAIPAQSGAQYRRHCLFPCRRTMRIRLRCRLSLRPPANTAAYDLKPIAVLGADYGSGRGTGCCISRYHSLTC